MGCKGKGREEEPQERDASVLHPVLLYGAPNSAPWTNSQHKHRHSDALRETKKRVKLGTPKGSSLLSASVS